MKRIARIFFAAVSIAALLAPCLWAQIPFQPKGTVLKYDQPIRHVIDPFWPDDMGRWGENIWSDVDWNKIMESPTLEPNWVIADDFRDEFTTPVRTVRWWGSYNPNPTVFQDVGGNIIPVPPGPGVEDGYVISFFRDVPVGPDNPFSHPGDLLGTYVLPLTVMSIKPTPYIGWDEHPIWEYEANLMDAHLDHGTDLADPMGFNQKPGEVYWISIMAEVGHLPVRIFDPATGEDRWVVEPTGKRAQDHYWGWHTSPVRFNDVATMGHLFMPGNQWEYFGWMPIQPRHQLLDMAFQLYTIPEPATLAMVCIALAVLVGLRRRS